MESARGASPIGQIVALYDAILRDFVRALAALKAKDIETRVFELNHALTVIGYLQYILDHERGGESAKHFARFYDLTRGMIVQANIRATPESIEELIDLYGGMRKAWYQADQKLSLDQQPAPPATRLGDAPGTRDASPATDDSETVQLQWSA